MKRKIRRALYTMRYKFKRALISVELALLRAAHVVVRGIRAKCIEWEYRIHTRCAAEYDERHS